MREIKFRAWHYQEARMIEWKEMVKDAHVMRGILAGEKYMMNPPKLICEPMQYTGLKDKNGKDIYEGDIVRCYGDTENEIVGDIYWGKAAFHVRTIDVFWSPDDKDWEVIGNIYENPELLK